MVEKTYTIVVHYKGDLASLYEVDPDKYSYFDLKADIKELFKLDVDLLSIVASTHSSKCRMPIDSDYDVLRMFDMNSADELFDLYVLSTVNESTVSIENLNASINVETLDARVEVDNMHGEVVVNNMVGHGNTNKTVRIRGSSRRSDVGTSEKGKKVAGQSKKKKLSTTRKQPDRSKKGKVKTVQTDEEDNNSDDSLYVPEIDVENLDNIDFDAANESDNMSNYESDDHCGALNVSDEEFDDDPFKNTYNYPAEQVDEGSGRVELRIGQYYTSVEHLRKRLKDYVIQEGFTMIRKKNDLQRVTVECENVGCNWRLHASVLPDGTTFQIKTYNSVHKCLRSDCTKEASADWIASKVVKWLRKTPGLTPKDIQAKLDKYNIKPNYMQVYRAKSKVVQEMEGSHSGSYGKLPYYARVLQRFNEGSVVTIQSEIVDGPSLNVIPTFQRIFVGLATLAKGFYAGCTPFIGFDGCHLKGEFGGVLLAAISLDGNNGLYPLAFAVVETENKDSWSFFFENLGKQLGGFDENIPWTFMSDRQKGLNETIKEIVPHANNRRCARHIYANFRMKFAGNALKRYFWEAARTYNKRTFIFAMNKILELNPRAHAYLAEIPPEMWSRHAFDPVLRNDHCTNSISESFNHWVGKLRGKPILALIDGLRGKLMSRLNQRRVRGLKWKNQLVPNVVKKLNKIRNETRKCSVLMAGDDKYEIKDGPSTYVVDMIGKSCQCREWDITGIPCMHAHACIAHRRERLEDYTADVWSTTTYMRCYSHMIAPVPDDYLWEDMPDVIPRDLLPPKKRRLPGRPKKNRRKESGESQYVPRSSVVKCRICNQFGHNKRTCLLRIKGESSERAAQVPVEDTNNPSLEDTNEGDLDVVYASLDQLDEQFQPIHTTSTSTDVNVEVSEQASAATHLDNEVPGMEARKKRKISELCDKAPANVSQKPPKKKRVVQKTYKRSSPAKGIVINEAVSSQQSDFCISNIIGKGKEKLVISQPEQQKLLDQIMAKLSKGTGFKSYTQPTASSIGKQKTVLPRATANSPGLVKRSYDRGPTTSKNRKQLDYGVTHPKRVFRM